ncbi:thioesterase II family protein [Streptomyces albiaxialis]|uniref:thioesterase II family protein n=1 Tax=Streptomyces albiaxialis TaxID=329523 RepID=UPI0031D529B9
MTDPWLRCRAPRDAAAARVVCLPHAGGTAGYYAPWGTELPRGVELSAVQYPGREDRILEPPPARLDALVADIAAALLPLTDRPLTLYGHSLGAVVAYEVARRLETAYGVTPAHLVVSGRRAPSVPVCGDLHRRPDEELVAELARLGGTRAELLRDPGVRSVLLPAVRADFALAETYTHRPGPPLACPVTAVIGTADTEVDEAQARRWAAHTTGAFAFHALPGGHFFSVPDRAPVLALLAGATGAARPPDGAGRSAPDGLCPVPSESESTA